MPNWLQVELALVPIIVVLLGAIAGGIVRFSKLEAKCVFLEKMVESNHGGVLKMGADLNGRFDELDRKLDGLSDRMSHMEGYMKRSQEDV